MLRTDYSSLRKVGALATVLLSLTVVACDSQESRVSTGNRLGVIHVGNGAEPETIDPHIMSGEGEVNIARALFEGLVRLNPITLAVDPGVAKRWEVSDNGKNLTFFLNPEASWSNGDPVNAHDFEWSFRRSLHPKMGNQVAYTLFPIVNAEAYASGKISDPDMLGVRALDEHTLEIRLNNPTPTFLQTLSYYPAYPVHRKTIEAHGATTERYSPWTRQENFVGNGPFNLSDWKIYRHLKVTRSETYWDADNVALNEVVFRPVDNETTEEKMFRAGQLHHTSRVPTNKIPYYRSYTPSPYQQAPMLGTYYFVFNTDVPPLDKRKVREALASAIDRKQLVASVLDGTGFPSRSLTPHVIPDYTPPMVVEHDPDRARELLAEAGFPGGTGWPGLELLYNTSENHRRIAIAIQQMWSTELNIKVELVNLEWKVYLATKAEKNYQISREGWIGGVLDPSTFLNRFTTDGGTNYTGFSNARYDEIMLKLAPASADPAERMSLLHEAETILMREVPLVPLYTYNSKHLVQPSVEGAPPNVLEIQDYKYVRLNPDIPAWQGEE